MQLWEDNIEIVDGKFQLPIPWKNGGPQLPNNYSMALKRFQSLLARLKGERLFKQYDEQIKKLLDEGYAEFVPSTEINKNDGSVWYLPHRYVKKKDGKLRIVHDCAAELHGISLNKSCLQGPANGGFRLTKFICNSEEVMAKILLDDQAKEAKLPNKLTKALGVKWDVTEDILFFSWNLEVPTDVTKRQILKCIASIYDPIGLISPVILGGRILLQEITRQNTGWDQAVDHTIQQEWIKWLDSLKLLDNVKVSRCVIPETNRDLKYQIHLFSDASLKGYGCAAYLRSDDCQGRVTVSLLFSKARVAPIKQMTVPRLELCAAVLSVKVNMMLERELDISLDPAVYWTDSQVVLAYISNSSKRYHTFVSNRISLIRSNSEARQWNYLPSIENPADIASRGMDPDTLVKSMWFSGPGFLLHGIDSWPPKYTGQVPDTDLEVKRSFVLKTDVTSVTTKGTSHPSFLGDLILRKSSFFKLKRIVGWILLFKLKLLKKLAKLEMSCAILDEAENILIKEEQSKLNLKNYPCLSPYIDSQGLARVGGRLKHFSSGQPHPILIPGGHLCNLIIRDMHEKSGHMGTEYVLASLRTEGKWISRKYVKSVIVKCVTCKRCFGKPKDQKMADLPKQRVSPNPPFTYTGVDCFGPFTVKRGRAQMKRWGCIFTCLLFELSMWRNR